MRADVRPRWGHHPIMQLSLFEGSHLPRTAAREALARGDFDEAGAHLAGLHDAVEEAADAARLEQISASLRAESADPVRAVHDAFAAALAEAEPSGFLSDAEWLRPYARCVAAALAPEPGRSLRGWLGAHFLFATGDLDAARRAAEQTVGSVPPGPAWIEAARLGFELGLAARAREWIHAACLASPFELAADPPALEHCGVRALDAAPLLPPLPAAVEDLFSAARSLEGLKGPWMRWVAVVGEIDRVLAPWNPGDGTEGPSHDADDARAFLLALRAARRSRERDRSRGPDRCSDRELRARRRMQRLAPTLLERYLRTLRQSLF